MKLKKMMVITAAFSMALSVTACGSNNNSTNNGGNNAAKATNNATTETAAPESTDAAVTDEIVPEDGATLVVWESKEERPFADEIAKQFTAKYNVPVKVEELAPRIK